MKYPGLKSLFAGWFYGVVVINYGQPALALDTIASPDLKTPPLQFVSASAPEFLYEGRFDFSNPEGPTVIWEGSRISIDFEGTKLALRFAEVKDQNFLNVQIDSGAIEVLQVPSGKIQRIELRAVQTAGRHRLVLFKRTEAAAGQARFIGVEIQHGAHVWAPRAPEYKLRMEFFGDSIMVGACNEDGATDQWENRSTHNNALSYTALTAGSFSADYRCIAVSGMGIATGYVEVKAGEVWNRVYPAAGSAVADLQAWPPDVAFVNFGENDDSFSRGQHQSFPAGYSPGYVALVKAMRAAYPQTHFVLLRGGMYGGSQSAPLREAWDTMVKEVESSDPAVSHYVFTHWSSTHPRVSDDRVMADELTAWLKRQAFMKRFL